MSTVYIWLGIYVAILLIISYIFSRRQSDEDYFISGRNRPGWQIFASKFAASIGVGLFITYTGFAYEFGLGTLTLVLGAIIAYPLFAYWAAPKIYKNSEKEKFYTLGDFVYSKTKSEFAKTSANILSSGILFAWLITGIIGGGKIINDFGFLSYNIAVLITSLVVLTYILMAGFRAVILTDIFQAGIIIVLLFVVTFGIIGSESIGTILETKTGGINIGTAIGFFLYGILAVFSSADRYQLTYASKDEKNLKHGLGFAVFPMIIASLLVVLIGLFMASRVQGLDTGLVFTEALKNFLPASLLPLSIVLFFAGIMSSADTNIYAISSHYELSRKNKTRKGIRRATIVLVVISSILALLFPDVVDVSIIAGGITLTLSVAMVYVISGGENKNRFLGSMFGGLIGLAIGIAIFGLTPTIALPTIIVSIFGLLWKGKI